MIGGVFIGSTNLNNNVMKKEKIKITYFFDALCGWCYGFSPIMKQIKSHYEDSVEFEIVSGGLKVANDAGPIGVVAPYIKQGAYKVVEDKCGVKFGKAFCEGTLEEGTMVLNSVPPAIALSIVKDELPDKAFEFGEILHKAIYVDGMHPENIAWYGNYAEKIGMSAASFTKKMTSKEYLEKAYLDFEKTEQNGISGFPTLVAAKSGKNIIVSRGYENFESVRSRIQDLMPL